MRSTTGRNEILLLLACTGLVVTTLLLPPVAQPGHYHGFADQRTLWGLSHAMDVLSNLPFALASLSGVLSLMLLPARSLSNVQRAMASLFFAGLALTAPASAWYHLLPDDAGLAIDRCGMAVAFAGLVGLAAAGRVSERGGAALGMAALLLGPYCVHLWTTTGNVLPWAMLQFGGMALIVWLAMLRPRAAALDIRWSFVIGAYALAKLLEQGDQAVYAITRELVSGHTLKHVVAALAAWPVISAIVALGRSRQNASGRSAIARIAPRRGGHA
jgi:hypothetical protein